MRHYFLVSFTVLFLFRGFAQNTVIADTTEILGEGLSIPTGVANFNGPMNAHIYTQEVIHTHKNYQYTTFYNQDRKVVLGRRHLCEREWEFIEFLDYTQSEDDRHNMVSMGICRADGTIHLAFDHHVDTLNYRVSDLHVANYPESYVWDENLFSPVLNYLNAGNVLDSITYPKFIQTTDGHLNVYFRKRGSGNADSYISFYNGRTHQWDVPHKFIDRFGDYQDPFLNQVSSSRNAYTFDLVYDENNVLHASWVWREAAQARYNHDIGYAWSNDYGKSWFNNEGQIIGFHSDTLSTPITYFSEAVNVWLIDSRYGMINNGGQCLDQFDQPHLLAKHRIEPLVLDTPQFVSNSDGAYFHYWRDSLGMWQQQELPFVGNRAKLYNDEMGNLYIPFVGGQFPAINSKLKVLAAKSSENWQNWNLIYESDFNAFRNEPSLDRARLESHGILSILTQDFINSDWQGTLHFSDIKTDNNALSTIQLDPIADAYTRGGIYADENHGAENALVVKDIENTDFDRETFLKFDLAALADLDVQEILSAKLILNVKVGNNGFDEELYDLHQAEDNWQEDEINWNNAPVALAFIGQAIGQSGRMEWDITQALIAESNGDGIISLRIRQSAESENPIIHYFSKEADVSGWAPHIVIRAEKSCHQDYGDFLSNISEPIQNNLLTIYPNPALNEIEIQAPERLREIHIFDVKGKKIRIEPQNSIDISGLSAGLYTIRALSFKNHIFSAKFIKQ